MKTLIKTFYFFGFAVLLLQCKTAPKTGIEIGIADAKNMKVFLDRTQLSNETEILASAEIDGSGTASLMLPDNLTPGMYRVRIGAKKHQLILDGTEKLIKITGSLNDVGSDRLTIEGSPWTKELMSKIAEYGGRKMDLKAIEDYATSTGNPLNGLQFVLSTLGTNPDFHQVHKNVLKSLKSDYSDTKYYKDYEVIVKQISAQYDAKMAQQRIKVGEIAPEISMPNLNGKKMALSEYKGKVVLVDFWASWCGPCRKSNPHLVEVYNKYKNKGFDVLSVSLDGLDDRNRARFANGDKSQLEKALDKQKDRWEAAIKKDKLTWAGHVSDLLKWDTPAAKEYGVKGIPKTFLIDRDGKIAAVNPRYNLEEELLKIL